MTRNPIMVPPDWTVEETAEIFLRNEITGAPVVDRGGQLVGIITQSDLFRVVISLTGLRKRGVELAFRAEDRPGSIKELTDIIRSYGGRLVSILSSYENAPEGYRNIYVRAFRINRKKLSQLQSDLSNKASILYVVDHRTNRREIH